MKKIYSLIPALLLFLIGQAQTNCNAGYESPTFASTLNTPANTIFTLTVNSASAGTLTGISFYDAGLSTANIKCCVYDDNAGVPGNLVASTSAYQLTMVAGPVTLTVTPVFIPPGNYHVGAVADQSGSLIPYDNSSTLTLYAYPSAFSNPFPPSGSSFVTTNGSPVNIWMNITCSAAGMNDHADVLTMNSFPNPVTDQLSLIFHSETAQQIVVAIYNSCGQLASSHSITLSAGENSSAIGMDDLSEGIYFVRVLDENGALLASEKLVKQ